MHDFNNKKVLISAGPTVEDIDPVRFLSNRSSGKMGLALADKAYKRGADVTLIIGPVHINIPDYLKRIDVRSAENMYDAVLAEFPFCDIFIASAAVADYTPLKIAQSKLKKAAGNLVLELKRTKDIVAEITALKSKSQKVIGFSVETENLLENSRNKMIRKNLDMIIANNPSIKGAAFGGDTNQVEILTKDRHVTLGLADKGDIADEILDHILLLEH